MERQSEIEKQRNRYRKPDRGRDRQIDEKTEK